MNPRVAPLVVFVGGCMGGGLRLVIDELVPATAAGLPVDIVVINIIGAFAMGVLVAWVMIQGARWWVPMLGTGALGAFTTFSALAALPWLASTSGLAAVSVLAATIVGSVAAAAAGWKGGASLALAQERRAESSP
ncbi:fluoride efflux transporter FluC [Demequina sp. SO4-13]